MKRMGWTIGVLVVFAQAMGCNRQDADALSNIGQMLVQRAKSMPIVTPQAKPIGVQPGGKPDDGKRNDLGS